MKVAVFRVVASCSLAEICLQLRGACCYHGRPDNGAASTSGTPADFCQTTRRSSPEDSHHLPRGLFAENLLPFVFLVVVFR
jgi:hypothetical protein